LLQLMTRAIQELAGHGEIVTTQRYMHLSPAAIDSAMALLEQRGNIVATAAATAENINRYRGKLVAGARNRCDLPAWWVAA
jgi:hypothetical protein